MAKVLTYSNTALTCYSTVQVDNGESVFISIVGAPNPSITVSKSRFLGLKNTPLWSYTAAMAGSIDAYALRTMRAFGDPRNPTHPLDAIQALVMTCASSDEVRAKLLAGARRMDTPLPEEEE